MAKKEKPTPEYSSERKTRVLLEDMNKSIKTIAEGHSILNQKIDKIDSELTFVKAAVTEVDVKVKKLDAKVGQLDARLERVEQKLDTVTEDHEKRITKLEAIKS